MWGAGGYISAPAIPARSGGVVDEPREGRVVDGVPYSEDHVARVEMTVADLQLRDQKEIGRTFVEVNIHTRNNGCWL